MAVHTRGQAEDLARRAEIADALVLVADVEPDQVYARAEIVQVDDPRPLVERLADVLALSNMAATFDPNTPFELWAAAATRMITIRRHIDWWIADIIAFGDERYGEQASAVLPTDQWAYQTLANAAWVARRFPPQRRREGVAFGMFEAVASLEPQQADALLDQAQEGGWKREELREAVRVTKRENQREAARAAPVPEVAFASIQVLEGDAADLPIDDASVDLIITSPPYGVFGDDGSPYAGPDRADEWEQLMRDFVNEAKRVARPGCRLAVNIPLDTTNGGYRPTYAQFVQIAIQAGWTYRFTIVWQEGNISKSVARGSVDSPQAIHVMAPFEMIPVFSLGPWRRDPANKTWDLTHEEWLDWTNGGWELPGESTPWEGFEAAFPVALPLRLIKLLSFKEDVVCDPFVGSGTTAVAAQRTGRSGIFTDNDPERVASTKRRLAAIRGLGAG